MSDGSMSTSSQSEGLSDNAAGAIAYITVIPSIIFLVMAPYNTKPFVKFHALQNIGLCIVAIVVSIALAVVSAIVAFIPFIRVLALFIYPLFGGLFSLALLVVWVLCVMKAYQGSAFKIPGIAGFAAKQSGYNG